MKAATIAGSYTGNLSETKELLDLARRGVVPNIPIQRRQLSEAAETLEDLKAGRVVGRVVLTLEAVAPSSFKGGSIATSSNKRVRVVRANAH